MGNPVTSPGSSHIMLPYILQKPHIVYLDRKLDSRTKTFHLRRADTLFHRIYPQNFPKLINVAEHCKDHFKAEIKATKKRIIELGGSTVEEHFSTLEHVGLVNDSGSINSLEEDKGNIGIITNERITEVIDDE